MQTKTSSRRDTLRRVLTPSTLLRLVLGWVAWLVLTVFGTKLDTAVSTPVLIAVLAATVAVIVVCSFGVVTQAEHLAHRLGDPYGTLILTISIAAIEVILISAVMLGPGKHPTIARDSIMAVSMIILNLVVGLAILVAARGRGQGPLRANRAGVTSYIALLLVLSTLAFALPVVIGREGSFLPWQQGVVVVLTVLLYGYFLVRQMGAQKRDFQEVAGGGPGALVRKDVREVLHEHGGEVLARSVLLVALMGPVVLLSHTMAVFLDEGVARLGAPVALSGLLVAVIVFLPETITTLRAAQGREMQRVSNLCHGALLSTMGLTIPAVLLIGALTGQQVIFGESPGNLLLLAVTMLVTISSFGSDRVTAAHGAAHLALFGAYGLVLFS